MPGQMQEDTWYVVDVPVPAGLDADQTREFLKDMARKLTKTDPHGDKVRAQVTRPKKQPPPKHTSPAGMRPLYVCHNKM